MKNVFYLILFVCYLGFGQNHIETKLLKKSPLPFQSIIGMDRFGTIYYLKNNIFYKQNEQGTLSYNNLQLGNVSSVNTFNPLKVSVFYKDFNNVIILDNRLAEIFKIDFNITQPYKNITHVSTGNDNTLWIYNQDTQELELYDYKTNKTRASTLPILNDVIALISNYNECWLLTKEYLYKYNYFGSLILKMKNEGYSAMQENNGSLYLKKDKNIFIIRAETNDIEPLKTPELLIKQFLVTNQTLYICTQDFLFEYQLITN